MSGPAARPNGLSGSSTAPARRWGDLFPRLASAVVMIAVALGTAIAGGHVFVLFWLLASAAILWEWQRLVGAGVAGLPFGVGSAALAIGVPLADAGQLAWAAALLLAGGVATAAVACPGLRAMAAAGLAYAAALALSVTVLRASFPGGLESILWLFAVVWGTDVFAYFGGRLIGGPKLWPRLSPSKTWSGFCIGIAAGATLGLAVSPSGSNHAAVWLLGLAGGAAAQGGDLFESSLKRHYGVKDASHIIPGHGGVMDRLDGFLVAATLAGCIGVARAGLDAAGMGLFNW